MKAKKQLEYTIHITVDEDGYYAEVPDLPGCSTSGETFESLMRMSEKLFPVTLGACANTASRSRRRPGSV